MDVIIYHNPDCGTSRNTLGLIRNAGVEPHIIELSEIPADAPAAAQCSPPRRLDAARIAARQGTPFTGLGSMTQPRATGLA